MKKIIAIVFSCFLAFAGMAQEKLIDRNAEIRFESNAEVDDDVRAVNNQVAAILVPSKEQVAFQVLIKSFEFKKALMQEHFNENYMESDKFPKAKFQGNIKDFSGLDFASTKRNETVISGEMEIKGIKKPFSATATIYKENGKYILDSEFKITITEFGIEIPDLVSDKVSKEFDVSVHAVF